MVPCGGLGLALFCTALITCPAASIDIPRSQEAVDQSGDHKLQQIRPPRSYVALGDSYAAGVGAGLYRPFPNNETHVGRDDRNCKRQYGAYPVQFTQEVLTPSTFTFLACAPESLLAVSTNQVPLIPSDAELISFTGGTVDVLLGALVLHCDTNYDYAHCSNTLSAAETFVSDTGLRGLRAAIRELLMGIRAYAPDALVVIIGFARFYGSPVADCVTHPGAQRACSSHKDVINQLMLDVNNAFIDVVDALNGAGDGSQAVDSGSTIDGTGFIFKSPDDLFTGHRYCDGEFRQWFVHYPTESEKYNLWEDGYFHPLEVGHRAYKVLLEEAWLEGSRRRQRRL
ncbi:MAG: hypothetical protein Q9160_008676 [Pyrenula sp. 1 TL-2023]